MEFDLDLDALKPQSSKIKINGSIIEVEPLKLEALLVVAELGKRVREVNDDSVIGQLKNALEDLVPEVKDQGLTIDQLMGLLNFLIEKAVPNENVRLKEKGVTSTEKKIEDSAITSPDSSISTLDTPENPS